MLRRPVLAVLLVLPLLVAQPADAAPDPSVGGPRIDGTLLTLSRGGGAGDDILWYAPGTAADFLWTSNGDGTYASRPLSIQGFYEPFAADFTGNGRTDVFWYRPGAAPDYLWLSNGDGTFTSVATAVSGDYLPITADLDGVNGSDILWYRPGAAPDYLWRSAGDGTFTSTAAPVSGTYRPFTGDFDGDGLGDIFWYRPGPLPDYLWFGRANGSIDDSQTSVSGDYQPIPGDYDGDHDTDVLWSRPGGTDFLWRSNGNGTFATSSAVLPDNRATPVPGDHDGDGDTDVLFHDRGLLPEQLLTSNGDGTFAVTAVFDSNADLAIPGDHDGDGRADLFGYSAGTASDFLWVSNGDRTYTEFEQQVNGSYQPIGGGAFAGPGGTADPVARHAPQTGPPPPRFPALDQVTVMTGLTIPWGLSFFPDGTMIVGERPGRVQVKRPGGTVNTVTMVGESDLWVSNETGRLGIAVDPAFASNRRFYSCQGDTSGPSVQVIAWQMNAAFTSATRVADPLVGGLPAGFGIHTGCRLTFGDDGVLAIATGDAAIGTTPQDPTSLGGKVLRVDAATGAGAPGNPFISSPNANTRRVFTWGHRNVQGLAVQPVTGRLWSVEHGPDRDDEINLLEAGANNGWDPVPGYNQNVPMTDTVKFPTASPAEFSTGTPTLAMSGADFIDTDVPGNTRYDWDRYQGGLAVASLKNSTLRVFFFDAANRFVEQRTIVNGTFGRLRTVVMGPDGALYVTTSNGNGTDRVIRITPR